MASFWNCGYFASFCVRILSSIGVQSPSGLSHFALFRDTQLRYDRLLRYRRRAASSTSSTRKSLTAANISQENPSIDISFDNGDVSTPSYLPDLPAGSAVSPRRHTFSYKETPTDDNQIRNVNRLNLRSISPWQQKRRRRLVKEFFGGDNKNVSAFPPVAHPWACLLLILSLDTVVVRDYVLLYIRHVSLQAWTGFTLLLWNAQES